MALLCPGSQQSTVPGGSRPCPAMVRTEPGMTAPPENDRGARAGIEPARPPQRQGPQVGSARAVPRVHTRAPSGANVTPAAAIAVSCHSSYSKAEPVRVASEDDLDQQRPDGTIPWAGQSRMHWLGWWRKRRRRSSSDSRCEQPTTGPMAEVCVAKPTPTADASSWRRSVSVGNVGGRIRIR